MGLISGIVELIKQAISWIKKVFQFVINGIFNFLAHCVNWFKSLRLDKNRHVPFVANGNQFKDMLQTAPKKNVGIFEGVFNKAYHYVRTFKHPLISFGNCKFGK